MVSRLRCPSSIARARHWNPSLLLLLPLLLGFTSLAAASGGQDTAIFHNPGIFVTLEQPFGSLTITEEMIRRGESDTLTAKIRVDSSSTYSLLVEIASDADVDLAGSVVNTAHPFIASARDVFLIRVSDQQGLFNEPWERGSAVAGVSNQAPTSGRTAGATHLIEVKVRFSDLNGPYFLTALPGDYTATLTYEVIPD